MRGILINNSVHTGRDFNMVMTAKDIPLPAPQTLTVEIPGRNGLLDLSESLTGEISYKNRTLKFNFVGDGSRETVLSLIERMSEYHGQYITVTTDDYPGWYYTGRANLTYSDKGFLVEFTLTIDAQPFRFAIIPKTYTVEAPDDQTVRVYNEGRAVVPIIITTDETTVKKGDKTTKLSAGTYEAEGFILSPGYNDFTLTSDGTVTITYTERAI